MASIGDLFFTLRADLGGAFEADLTKAGGTAADKAGQTIGQRLSGSMGKALKATVGGAIGAGLGAAVAMASKGALELDTATAKFTAQTGLAGDAATDFAKNLSALYKTNVQGYGEIGDTLIALQQHFKLSGKAAEDAGAQFLDFARIAGTDAATAVGNFDELVDAGVITVDEMAGFMDKLTVSHQKFGVPLQGTIDALVKFAPAMKAAGLSTDDALGLMNLFTESGLDAEGASVAFAKALNKVKSPEELQRLIDQISATEDPFERAQLAADLFGVKAGAKLANALKPGADSIDSFTVTTDESAGATKRAGDALDSAFGTQVALKIKAIGGALAEIGTNFGPLLMGFAMLVPVLGPVLATAGAALGGILAAAIPVGMAALPAILIAALVGFVALLIADEGFRNTVAGIGGAIIEAISQVLQKLPEVLGQIVSLVVEFLGSIPGKLPELVSGLVQLFVDAAGQIGPRVLGLVGNIVSWYLSIPGKVVGIVASLVGQAAQIATDVGAKIAGLVGDVVRNVLSIPGKVASWATDIVGQGAKLAIDLLAAVIGLVDDIVRWFLGIPAKIVGLGAGIVRAIIDGLASLPGKLLDAVRNAFANIHFTVGPFTVDGRTGVSINLPDIDWGSLIPKFAVGAWNIPADMLAVVHAGEMIVPAAPAQAIRSGQAALGRGEAALGGASHVTNVYVYNPAPEPASTSVKRELQKLAAFGTLA